MDELLIKILGALGLFGLGFLSSYINRNTNREDKLSDEHITATKKNTEKLIELNFHIERLLEEIKSIPKIKEDLNNLYARVKIIENK